MNILQAHADVFLTLLDADNTNPALVVVDSVVTNQAPPYVLVYFAYQTPSGVDEPDKVSLEATSDVLHTTAYCHSVGITPQSARTIAGRVRAALLGKTPTVAGRVCFPLTHQDGPPMVRDETTGTAVLDQVDVYRFTSLPG